MKQITQENNFLYLCAALVALLFFAALGSSTLGENLLPVITIATLIVSIKSIHTDITWKKTVYLLIVFLIAVNILAKMFESQFIVYINLFILLVFFAGSFWSAYRQILFTGTIDQNKIIGSVSLFLLLGLLWTMIYLILFVMDPNAFSGIEAATWQEAFSRMAYYSFVTLTTLGYGEILPTNRLAEFFVIMEVIIGVFYMAIIVSSLVSVRLAMMDDEKANIDKKDK